MRTGSNLLNSHLNQYSGIVCHGEVFNPSFIGLSPEYLERFGLGRNDVHIRNADSLSFLERATTVEGLAVGLHIFPGHDSRVLDTLLLNAAVKKICLRRSIIHSFISLQIAKKTDVWRVTKDGPRAELPLDMRRVIFDATEFEEYRRKLDGFWHHCLKSMASSEQAYLPIWYRQLNDVDSINRVVEFLGLPERKKALKPTLDKQNPEPLEQIVVNWEEMKEYARKVGLDHQI
jgi:hypothetical protein